MSGLPPLGDTVGMRLALEPVLAHQGGWDEMLMVAAPIALIALVLWLANRRANRIQAEARRAAPEGDETQPSDRTTAD